MEADQIPLLPMEQLKKDIMSMNDPDVKSLMARINAARRQHGYLPLHQREIRKKKGYFHCSCKHDKCSSTILVYQESGRAHSKKVWTVSSIGSILCEPREPFGVALENTVIPNEIKDELVDLYDSGTTASDAFETSKTRAQSMNLPLTWEKSDVKNFFDRLKMDDPEAFVRTCDALAKHGHFVKLDVKKTPGGKFIVNRFFIVFSWMLIIYEYFGKFVGTLDSTYG